MKAGAALGLLAGLGALNALSGGRNGTGKRFTGLLDMLDGGGAGASGDRFEGGGLLSILGNLFAKPLEAQDRVERIAADTNATRAVTKTLEDMAKGGTPTSRLDGKDGLLSPAQKEQIVMDQVVNPDVYNIGQGGEFAGSMLAPRATTTQSAPAPSYATMRMGEAGRGMPDVPVPVVGRKAVPLRTYGHLYDQPDMPPDYASDPLIGGTRNPSAYRPIDMSSQEMRPIVDPRSAGPMSYEEYVPYISDLYRKEYGQAPTEQQLLSAYQVYTQSMGM